MGGLRVLNAWVERGGMGWMGRMEKSVCVRTYHWSLRRGCHAVRVITSVIQEGLLYLLVGIWRWGERYQASESGCFG